MVEGAEIQRDRYGFLKLAFFGFLLLIFSFAALSILRLGLFDRSRLLERDVVSARNVSSLSFDQRAGAELEMLTQLLRANKQSMRGLSDYLNNSWQSSVEPVQEDESSLPAVNTPIQSAEYPKEEGQGFVENYENEDLYVPEEVATEVLVDERIVQKIIYQRPVKNRVRSRNVDDVSKPLSQTSRDFRDVPTLSDESRRFGRGLGNTREDIAPVNTRNIRNGSRGFGRGLGGTRGRISDRSHTGFRSRALNETSQDFRDTPTFIELAPLRLDPAVRAQFESPSSSFSTAE